MSLATITAAYLFLAITLAPGLAKSGLNDLAIHMFILYWAMISFITPPVAIGAYAAAGIAKSNPMKTGLEAMRLGTIIYFVPFFFVLNPALIGIGEPLEVIIVFLSALVGIILVSAGLQGYLIGAGQLSGGTNPLHWILRLALFASGMLLALPGTEIIGFTHLQLNTTAVIIGIPAVALTWMINRGDRRSGAATT